MSNKNKIMKRFLIFLTIPIVLQSCSSIYIPATRSIPLLEKKGEFQGEAGISTNSIYANGSYAFTNNIAASINGNLSYRNFSNRYDAFTDKYEPPPTSSSYLFGPPPDRRGKFSHRYGEVSVGKINMLPNILSVLPMKLEIFGGMGIGRATDIDQFKDDNRYKSDYYAFFGQGNFGIKHRIFEAGGSIRLAYSHFNYTADIYDYWKSEYVLYQKKVDVLHAEPMLFARVGKGNLKFVARIGVNFVATINPNNEYPDLRGFYGSGKLNPTTFHLSLGISYRIAGKNNKN
jgi:hypothetical protein